MEQQVSARVPSYVPSVAQPVTPGVKPRHAANGAGKQMDKVLPTKQSVLKCLDFVTCPFADMLLYLCAFVFFSDLGKFRIQVVLFGLSHCHLSLLCIFHLNTESTSVFYVEAILVS